MPTHEGGGEAGYVREQLGRIAGKLDGLADTMQQATADALRRDAAVWDEFRKVRHYARGIETTMLSQDAKWELRLANLTATQDERHRDNLEAQLAMKATVARLERPVHQFVRLRERRAGMIMVLGALGAIATTLAGLIKPAWETAWTHLVARWFGS